MSTKQANIQPGQKISGRKANADRFIPLHEFLMFDPVYRLMSEKAKLLYSYLRHKTQYFERQTEDHENGEEGTKSYRDDNGHIYCVADNTDLEYLLNSVETTVIRVKKELIKFGLLLEEKTQFQANRLYVLEPAKLADRWTYIEEIKKLRAEKKEKNKQKQEKLKNSKKTSGKTSSKQPKNGNSKNASYGNSKNASYGNSKNASKNKYHSLNSTSNSKKELHLSITVEEIKESNLPDLLKTTLENEIDRLIYHNLSLSSIISNYELHKEQVTDALYKEALIFSLSHTEIIQNLSNIMAKNVNKQIEFATQRANAPKNAQKIGYKSTRKEALPDWFIEQQEGTSNETVDNEDNDEDFEKMKAIMAAYYKEQDEEQL
jgi:Replication initiator protein A (RepA) N-terminus